MVCFQTKNQNFGKFWRVLQWKMVEYVCIHSISFLRSFGIFYGIHFVFVWYIFSCFGLLYLEKSGNPGFEAAAFTTLLLLERGMKA
jgi:hypothetical protein